MSDIGTAEEIVNHVKVEYCPSWGYLPRAAGLAENLLHDFKGNIPGGVAIVPGRSGSFEVTWNGELIFSKYALDRFPDPFEVEALVADKLGVPPPQPEAADGSGASGG